AAAEPFRIWAFALAIYPSLDAGGNPGHAGGRPVHAAVVAPPPLRETYAVAEHAITHISVFPIGYFPRVLVPDLDRVVVADQRAHHVPHRPDELPLVALGEHRPAAPDEHPGDPLPRALGLGPAAVLLVIRGRPPHDGRPQLLLL